MQSVRNVQLALDTEQQELLTALETKLVAAAAVAKARGFSPLQKATTSHTPSADSMVKLLQEAWNYGAGNEHLKHKSRTTRRNVNAWDVPKSSSLVKWCLPEDSSSRKYGEAQALFAWGMVYFSLLVWRDELTGGVPDPLDVAIASIQNQLKRMLSLPVLASWGDPGVIEEHVLVLLTEQGLGAIGAPGPQALPPSASRSSDAREVDAYVINTPAQWMLAKSTAALVQGLSRTKATSPSSAPEGLRSPASGAGSVASSGSRVQLSPALGSVSRKAKKRLSAAGSDHGLFFASVDNLPATRPSDVAVVDTLNVTVTEAPEVEAKSAPTAAAAPAPAAAGDGAPVPRSPVQAAPAASPAARPSLPSMVVAGGAQDAFSDDESDVDGLQAAEHKDDRPQPDVPAHPLVATNAELEARLTAMLQTMHQELHPDTPFVEPDFAALRAAMHEQILENQRPVAGQEWSAQVNAAMGGKGIHLHRVHKWLVDHTSMPVEPKRAAEVKKQREHKAGVLRKFEAVPLLLEYTWPLYTVMLWLAMAETSEAAVQKSSWTQRAQGLQQFLLNLLQHFSADSEHQERPSFVKLAAGLPFVTVHDATMSATAGQNSRVEAVKQVECNVSDMLAFLEQCAVQAQALLSARFTAGSHANLDDMSVLEATMFIMLGDLVQHLEAHGQTLFHQGLKAQGAGGTLYSLWTKGDAHLRDTLHREQVRKVLASEEEIVHLLTLWGGYLDKGPQRGNDSATLQQVVADLQSWLETVAPADIEEAKLPTSPQTQGGMGDLDHPVRELRAWLQANPVDTKNGKQDWKAVAVKVKAACKARYRLRMQQLERVLAADSMLADIDGFPAIWAGAKSSLRDLSIDNLSGFDPATLVVHSPAPIAAPGMLDDGDRGDTTAVPSHAAMLGAGDDNVDGSPAVPTPVAPAPITVNFAALDEALRHEEASVDDGSHSDVDEVGLQKGPSSWPWAPVAVFMIFGGLTAASSFVAATLMVHAIVWGGLGAITLIGTFGALWAWHKTRQQQEADALLKSAPGAGSDPSAPALTDASETADLHSATGGAPAPVPAAAFGGSVQQPATADVIVTGDQLEVTPPANGPDLFSPDRTTTDPDCTPAMDDVKQRGRAVHNALAGGVLDADAAPVAPV